MNGKKAKMLRKYAYGDFSIKTPRTYITSLRGEISNSPESLRAAYQRMKKLFYSSKDLAKIL